MDSTNIFNTASDIQYLIKTSGKTPTEALLKLVEETGEYASALQGIESYKHDNIEHLQEEAVDVLQCAMSLYFLTQEIAPFDGEALMNEKNKKWYACYLRHKE